MAKKKNSLGPDNDLFRIASFMLFDAMLFHLVLANGHASVKDFQKRAKLSWKNFLRAEWLNIRDSINYKPVFDLAIDILDSLPPSPATEAILLTLASSAEDAVASGTLLKHDFVGRIYHKLLLATTGHYYATYYTSLPAAWLLAGLLFRVPHDEWNFSTLESIGQFTVIDPACGSGTLLSASYSAIRDLYVTQCQTALDTNLLHEVLVGASIRGWDVLDFAAHLSLTTLALHSDAVSADHSNIYKMPLGATKTNVHLGSLDYLSDKLDLKGIALTEPVEELGFQGSREVEIARELHDVVIMNPPFSRSAKPNVKFGFEEAEVAKRMRAKLSELGSSLNLRKAAVAGLTPFFMYLGLEMLKPNGRVGMVVPRSILSGVGSRDVRSKYEKETRLRFVVSNFDPGSPKDGVDGWSWSENTDIGEVLIVAEKASSAEIKEAKAIFVNVIRRPRNEVEALILSQEINRAVRKASLDLESQEEKDITALGQLSAIIYSVPQSDLKSNWLSPCTFASAKLNRFLLEIGGSKDLIAFTKLLRIINGEYATGRDIAPVKQNFVQHPVKSDARMVFGHQAVMNTISLDGSHIKHAKAKRNPKSGIMFKNFASTFLLSERPHLRTEALLAMQASERVLTTAFWEIQCKDDLHELWLVLWFNSTYGFMTYLATSTSSQADIFKMKKDQLTELKVPSIPKGAKTKVEDFFEKMRKKAFARYPDEFALAAEKGGARYQIDQFFSKLIDIPEIEADIYDRLSRDPVVTRLSLAAG